MDLQELKVAFEKAFGKPAQAAYFSPGRVNLIGEHTDYNGGHVFPCALSFGTWLLLAENQQNEHRFLSLNVDGEDWKKYPKNVIKEFEKLPNSPIHQLPDSPKYFDFLYYGNVPAGAGLSSSAAIEVVTAYALDDQFRTNLSRTDMALMSQAAEHACGVNCGIMDQFASAQGKQDHAIDLDCATLQFELVPVALRGMKVVIANTHSPHKLDSGAYNARVAQCQEALREIKALGIDIANLAQLSQADFDKVADRMTDPVAKKRARHVVGEVARTNEAIAALKQGDIERFGQLMNQSHISLRDDYEVTGPELDALAEAAWQVEGVIGSRMTGGGFGGCTVSIVCDEAIPAFIEQVGKAYTAKTGLKADFYIAEIGDGARKL